MTTQNRSGVLNVFFCQVKLPFHKDAEPPVVLNGPRHSVSYPCLRGAKIRSKWGPGFEIP